MIRKLKRIYRLLTMCVTLCLLAWFYVWGWADGESENRSHFSLLSFNVYGMKQMDDFNGSSLVLDGIQSVSPDLLVLQECPMRNRFKPLEVQMAAAGLKHHRTFPYAGNKLSGLAIFSRFPILKSESIELHPHSEGRLLALVDLDVDGRVLQLGGVHYPNSDIHLHGKKASLWNELFGVNLRTIQTESMLQAIQPLSGKALILAGDFNTFPISAAWRMTRAQLLDAFPPTDWLKGTFQLRGTVEVKIDHVFHTNLLESPVAKVLNLAGSDHKPVYVEFEF